jgi:hypothetical protein
MKAVLCVLFINQEYWTQINIHAQDRIKINQIQPLWGNLQKKIFKKEQRSELWLVDLVVGTAGGQGLAG